MSIREEYEDLKLELTVKLADTSTMCHLDFPFDFKLEPDEEKKYFFQGLRTRSTTKKMAIMLDNAYKKIRLFPSDGIMDTYTTVRDEILNDYKINVLNMFDFEPYRYEIPREEYVEYIDSLVSRIKEASIPYIEKLGQLTQEDIEKEIAAKDKLKQSLSKTSNNLTLE